VDLHGRPPGVERGVEQAGVDGGYDEVLELARVLELQLLAERVVREVGTRAGQREQGQLAELELLGGVQVGEAGGCAVLGVGPVAEDFEQGKVRGQVCGGESLDVWCGEELGEDECVRGRGCPGDEVGGCAGGGGGFCQGKEGLETGELVV
jgi:hypothetical protein